MKLLAARVERDQDDIREPYRLCGLGTPAESLAVVEAAYPQHVIPPDPPHARRDVPEPGLENDIGREPDRDMDIGF